MAELNKIDLGKYFEGDPRKIEEFLKYIDAFKEGINSIDAVLKRNKDQVSTYVNQVQSELRKINSYTLDNIKLFGKIEAEYFQMEDAIKRISQLEKDLADARKATAQVNIEAMKAARLAAEEVREANRKAAAEAKQQAKEQSEAAKKAARETAAAEKQKQKEILATQQTLEGLRAKLSLLTEKRNKLNIEIDPAQYKQVQDDIKNLNDQIKGIEQGGGDFRRKVGDYENSIKNALGDFFKSGDTSGLESFIGANTAKFAAFTGGAMAAAAAALKFLEATEKSNKEVALAGSITGLTGEKLDQYAGKLQAVSEKYGTEFNDLLNISNTLAKEFGVSQSQAIDEVNLALIEGADVAGEYLDIVREYGTQFARAGFSLAEFNKLSVLSAKNGIFQDKIPDMVKEVAIRLGDLSKSQKEALYSLGDVGKQVDKLFQSGNKKEAIQLLAQEIVNLEKAGKNAQPIISNLFGAPGEDAGQRAFELVAGFQKINIELTETEKRTMAATKANAEFNAEFNELSKNFEGITEKSSTFFTGLLTGITAALNKFFEFRKSVADYQKEQRDADINYQKQLAQITGSELDKEIKLLEKRQEALIKSRDDFQKRAEADKAANGGNLTTNSAFLFSEARRVSGELKLVEENLTASYDRQLELRQQFQRDQTKGTEQATQEQQAKNFEYLKYELEQKIKANQAKIDAEKSYLFEEFDLQQQNMKLRRQIAQLDYEQEISTEKVSHDQKLLARAKFRDQLLEIDKEFVAQERALLQTLNAEEVRQIQATDRLDKEIKKQREDMARPKIAKYDYAAGIDQTAKMDAEKVKNKMLQGLIDKRTYEESLRAIEKGTLQFKLDNAEKLKLSELEVLQIKNRILEIDKDSAKNVFDRLNDSAAKLRDTLGEAFTALFGEKQGKKIEAIAKLIAAAGAVVSPAGSNANAIFAGISGLNVKKFAEGVIDLEGGERGKDSIPALLMPGESVMTTEETRRFKPLLAGIREGDIKNMNDLLKPLPLAVVPPSLLQPVIAQFDTTGLERKLDSLEKTVRESRQNNDLFFDSTAKQFIRIEEKFNQVNKYIYAQKGRTPSIRD